MQRKTRNPKDSSAAAIIFDAQKINALAVRLHGRPVGVLTRLAGDRHLFAFEQDYIDDPQRPTLSLSFKGRTGRLVTAVHPVSRRVPPFFSNLLPEGHLRTYLAKHAGVKPEREFFLLAVLGKDLPGALTVTPLEKEEQAGELDEGHKHKENRMADTALRFLLAGVPLEFLPGMGVLGGFTIAAAGMGGFGIIQTPSARFPSVPENEHAMVELARTGGITVRR